MGGGGPSNYQASNPAYPKLHQCQIITASFFVWIFVIKVGLKGLKSTDEVTGRVQNNKIHAGL